MNVTWRIVRFPVGEVFPTFEVHGQVEEVHYSEVCSYRDPLAKCLKGPNEKLLLPLNGSAGGTSQDCEAIVSAKANVLLRELRRGKRRECIRSNEFTNFGTIKATHGHVKQSCFFYPIIGRIEQERFTRMEYDFFLFCRDVRHLAGFVYELIFVKADAIRLVSVQTGVSEPKQCSILVGQVDLIYTQRQRH